MNLIHIGHMGHIREKNRIQWILAVLLVASAFLFASDRSVEGLAESGGVNVPVNVVNQVSGDITVQGPNVISVWENTAIGTSIATYWVETSTGTVAPGEEFTFNLEGDDAGKYSIDPHTGDLSTAAWLDFETDVSDTIFVFASSETAGAGLKVTVNVVDVEDSVSTLRVSKANPVPGIGRGNPEHALDDAPPLNFVDTEWARWGTILRFEIRSESPDPDCGTGLDCVRIRLESDEAEAVQELEAIRSGERGIRYVAGVMLVGAEGDTDVRVNITGFGGRVRQVNLLEVDEEDEVEIIFGRLRSVVDVENEPPEFDDLEIEQGLDFERVDVEFTFDVTDAHSGMPEPEDLPDLDEDEDYTPVTALVHNSQCYSSVESEESLDEVEGVVLEGGLIYCDGVPEIYPIRDDRDFDEIDDGYEVTTSLILGQGMTYFVTFIACDNAGNCTAYDADEDSDALLLRIDTPEPIPVDPCVARIAGDTTIEGSWDGTCPSGRAPEPYGGQGARYARYYTFSLDSTSEVTITLTSDEDTYLYLLEGAARDGVELFENDDVVPTQDLNSRIEATLEAGNYTIEATTYHSQKTGEFTLEVSGIGRAAPVDADCSSGIVVDDPDENAGLVSDCEALLAVRDKLAGTAILNWSAGISMEEWDGVVVKRERVTGLHLFEQGLTGVIPPEIGDLDSLEELLLTGNRLSGEIPRELAMLGNLESLWLEENRLTGAIPPELSRLNLKGLFLSHNQLTGSIPAELSHITNLAYLELDDNRLSGEIPQELGNLTRLTVLYLSGNDLSGCVPDALRNIEEDDFAELGLLYCEPDEIPPPPMGTCVVELGDSESGFDDSWEDDCLSVNRPIDDKRPRAGNYYARYYTFGLSERSEVEITLKSTTDTYLYVLSGAGADGNALHSNDDIDYAAGIAHSRIEVLLEAGEYTIEATTYAPRSLGAFTLTVSGIGGTLTLETDRDVLEALYTATDGDNWTNNDNWLTHAPLDEWHGVSADSAGLVFELTLRDNRLSGEIPSELNDLSELVSLDLSRNQLTGSITAKLSGLVDLEQLYLNSNRLTGNIPADLSKMRNLRGMDLSDNLLVGEIPPEFAALPELNALFLSGNALTGCIPHGLRDVEENDFEGLGLPFCENVPGYSDRVFDGGVDLEVTYIERLPRYERYKLAYFYGGDCQYPFQYPYSEFLGAVVCPEQDGIKRWPDAGETVELIAHVWNFGDTASGPFDYRWGMDGSILLTDRHEGLASGVKAEIRMSMLWPTGGSNPLVTFNIDPENKVEELLETNNFHADWIKGYTFGFYFSPIAYESLTYSNEPGETIQSPEHWVHKNIHHLNGMLADAGVEDRIRTELFLITDDPFLDSDHDLRYFMDGWWRILDKDPYDPDNPGHLVYTLEGYEDRPDIDFGMLHEIMHQLGVIDLYQMHLGPESVLLPDANRPDQKAGCGRDYWNHDWECFRFNQTPGEGIEDLMSSGTRIGPHTAGGLMSNTGHRRGFFGEYLYDTPQFTSVRVVDSEGGVLPNVNLRFYQKEEQPQAGYVVDPEPEFALTTDGEGIVRLPNRGITGIVTATGHQLRPNPFGAIDVVGRNGIFIIEMDGAFCTNYEWLTVVDLNLAYWGGQEGDAVIDRTFRCPPAVVAGGSDVETPGGTPTVAQPGSEDPRRLLPPPYIPPGLDAPKPE